MGLAGGSLSQAQAAQGFQQPLTAAAQGLFNLGQQYIAESPEAAAQRVMSQQQGLLAPQREQQLANIRNQLQQTGRAGLATGATTAGGLAATNPEMAAYYNAIAQQDAQLAANAQQQAQQQAAFGAGLFGTGAGLIGQGYGLQTQALAPWQSYLGGAQTIEGLGQQALTTGAGLGSSAAQAGAQQGASLLKAGLYSADALQKAASLQTASTTSSLEALTKQLQDPIAKLIGSLSSNQSVGNTWVPGQY
jgi:CubicO group peptidase (beta-lactamase class C family)